MLEVPLLSSSASEALLSLSAGEGCKKVVMRVIYKLIISMTWKTCTKFYEDVQGLHRYQHLVIPPSHNYHCNKKITVSIYLHESVERRRFCEVMYVQAAGTAMQ